MKQSPIGVEEAVDQNGGPDKARRRALLARLGKGSAALAAMGPHASHAGNSSHKCSNANVPGGWGGATFSGYQSAVVSTSSATVGKACHPSHYCKTNVAPSSYQSFCGTTSKPTASQLASKINSYFGCGNTVTRTMVRDTLYASVPKSLAVTGCNLVICPNQLSPSTGGIALQAQNLPAGFNILVAFNSVFTNSTDTRTLLEVLYDAVQTASPGHARSYFVSTYLTVYGSQPATLPTGFDTGYVRSSYTGDANVGTGSDPYNFLKTLCVTT